MKAKALVTPTTSWPAGVPFFDPPSETRANSAAPQASVAPIELHIGSGEGPYAIAILE